MFNNYSWKSEEENDDIDENQVKELKPEVSTISDQVYLEHVKDNEFNFYVQARYKVFIGAQKPVLIEEDENNAEIQVFLTEHEAIPIYEENGDRFIPSDEGAIFRLVQEKMNELGVLECWEIDEEEYKSSVELEPVYFCETEKKAKLFTTLSLMKLASMRYLLAIPLRRPEDYCYPSEEEEEEEAEEQEEIAAANLMGNLAKRTRSPNSDESAPQCKKNKVE